MAALIRRQGHFNPGLCLKDTMITIMSIVVWEAVR